MAEENDDKAQWDETIPGGAYKNAAGQLVDAHGKVLKPAAVAAAKKAQVKAKEEAAGDDDTDDGNDDEGKGSLLDGTVAQVTERLATIIDRAELDRLTAEEKAGAKRAGVFAAITARAATLEKK